MTDMEQRHAARQFAADWGAATMQWLEFYKEG